MNMGTIETITKVYNKLSDEKSKSVFRAKFDLMIYKNESKFLEWILSEKDEIKCPELDRFESVRDFEYVIFGAGLEGQRTKEILRATNRNVVAFCDNNRLLWDTRIDDIKVISPAELMADYQGCGVIISARQFIFQIYQQLLIIGFPRENIIIPENGFLMGVIGKQYFDVFEPHEEEIFMDIGCWDGNTVKDFVRWCNGSYAQIYAFEPDISCWSSCEKTFEVNHIANVAFIKKGVSKSTETVYFRGIGIGSSKVVPKQMSDHQIPVTSIDDVLIPGNRAVTFIKMDIEGSEMEALIGGRKSIVKHKPRMAISVYHKPQDLWELADYILDLNPEYQLYMRHYTTCSYETILYAV